ncbi:phosphodiester glycosidase family protein [Nocardioides sp. NPDC101246]|uniref:phosphodiester glycosidase family protein n=1 Tax=Nocardioides sp. NPDC101246 TaxID=3364336 RepID=UPI00380D7BCE
MPLTLLVSAGPAAADVPPPPPTAVTLAPGGIPPSQQEANGYDFAAGGEALSTVATQDVAPGLRLTNFQRLEDAGWNRGNVLTADLSEPTLSMDVRNTGKVAGIGTLSSQMAETGAVAGVNAGFYDINASGAPVGLAKSRDGLQNARFGSDPALSMAGAEAAIGELTSGGTVTIDGAEHDLAGFNTPSLPTGGIGVYTRLWGDYTLDRPVGGPGNVSDEVARASVVDGVVTAVADEAGAPAIPADGQVLLGREAGAEVVRGLEVGDRVDVAVGLAEDDTDWAVSGNVQLVVDGEVGTGIGDDGVHSRTAVGLDRDGTRLIVLALDGQTGASRGMTRAELARFMISLGAYQALNLDGGGSTTMAARVAGDVEPRIVDTPSDGSEREVSNTLLFFSSAGPAGVATGAQVRPVTNRAGAYRVLQGQRRTLFGSGLDAAYAAVEKDGVFRAQGGSVRLGDGLSRPSHGSEVAALGARTGDAKVSFDLGRGRRATMPITVLGPLDHLAVDRSVIALPEGGGSSTLMLTGYDADGRPAPIEPSEAAVTASDGFEVVGEGANGFEIRTSLPEGSGTVDFAVGDHHVAINVLVGLSEASVADFADGASWKAGSARATVSVTPLATGGPRGEPALRIQHDFTQSTGTRGAYAVPPAPIAVAGQPLSLSMWVKGDGSGAWPRIQIRSGNGTVSNLDAPLITWTGWQQVTYPVPPGTAYPIRVEAVRMMETRPEASYRGDLTVAALVADVPPSADPIEAEPVHDPVIVTDGTVADRPQRIALMSDGQFVARDPDSPLVASVRATLREIVAARPDHLIIDGDLVDEASPADLAFAKKVLDEEIGSAVPYTYVPGNHEVMGGPISNFKAVFGPTHTTRLLGSTLLITLNSSSGTLHGNDDGKAQLTELESQLRAAASDPAVTGVLVAFHHPIDDPLPDKASQLGDRIEARQLEDRLGRFRTSSGKSVAVLNGHVGVFHGSSSQGISMLINGNSGKTPAGNVEDGGFRGWTMIGIDPRAGLVGRNPAPGARLRWLQAETRPAVDTVTTGAPETLALGSSVTLDATFTQGAAAVPITWPVTADWGGHGVVVGERGHGVVRLDPVTRKLTALRSGTAVLTLVVNGVKAESMIRVIR